MKILFNCMVNSKGGAVQNAANFISCAVEDASISYMYVVSKEVAELLGEMGANSDKVVVVNHPLTGREVRKKVRSIEMDFKPDVVYTMAGPTYHRFCALHVLGVSDGYITHSPTSVFFMGRGLVEGLFFYVKTFLKRWISRLEGDFYIFQTHAAALGYCSKALLSRDRFAVVPNALGKSFFEYSPSLPVSNDIEGEVVLLCPSADYPHKNLKIIFGMKDIIEKDDFFEGKKIIFKTTLPEESGFEQLANAYDAKEGRVVLDNLGPFSYSNALSIYRDCNVVFMPSLLETFSTSYLEAMASRKILLCSNREFAKDICGDAAYYFDAAEPYSAVEALKKVFSGEYVFKEDAAKKKLGEYGDFYHRYGLIVAAIKRFLEDCDAKK